MQGGGGAGQDLRKGVALSVIKGWDPGAACKQECLCWLLHVQVVSGTGLRTAPTCRLEPLRSKSRPVRRHTEAVFGGSGHAWRG